MKNNLLRDSIESLTEIRCELTGKVEDRVVCRIDEVIADLKSLQDSGREIDNVIVLSIIGSVLELVPAIADIVKMLSQK